MSSCTFPGLIAFDSSAGIAAENVAMTTSAPAFSALVLAFGVSRHVIRKPLNSYSSSSSCLISFRFL